VHRLLKPPKDRLNYEKQKPQDTNTTSTQNIDAPINTVLLAVAVYPDNSFMQRHKT
jgi:hypothetical protein